MSANNNKIDKNYEKRVKKASPDSPIVKDCIKAFLIGGLFCLIGQVLIDKTKLTPARILVCYVVVGVFLGAVGVYKPIVDFAGAGATVPLTGFGNTLAKGVIASAGGIAAAIFAGLLASLIFKAKDKS